MFRFIADDSITTQFESMVLQQSFFSVIIWIS